MTELNRHLDTIDELAYRELEAENKKLNEENLNSAVIIESQDKTINLQADRIEVLEDKMEIEAMIQEEELIKVENKLQQIKTDYNIEG